MRIELSCIGKELAKMKVVCSFELILDQNVLLGANDLADDVGGKAVNGMFGADQWCRRAKA